MSYQESVLIGYGQLMTSVFHKTQRSPVWCWAATLEMVLRIHGLPIDMEKIAEKAHGRSVDGRIAEKPGTISDVNGFLNREYLDPDGYHYIVKAVRFIGIPPLTDLKFSLNKHPVIMWRQPQGYPIGHLFLCTGVSVNGPGIESFHVLDPADKNIMSYKIQEMRYQVRHSWVIRSFLKSVVPKLHLRR